MRLKRLIVVAFLVGACCASLAAKVQEHVVLYPSIDQHGDSLMLSGKITIPKKPAKGIILMTHYTIGADKEAPSRCMPPEAKPFVKDYIFVMPDYIGYGATVDRFPPYLAGELTAINCADMLLYARSYLEDSLQVAFPADSLYILGYSQGGAAAMWTLKYLEENYASEFSVRCCFAGSGPYDVATTYDDGVAKNFILMPMEAPLLVMGTSEAYDLNLQHSDFFTHETEKRFEECVVSKKHGIFAIYMRMNGPRLDKWLTQGALDKNQPETKRLYEGLLRSSLVHYDMNDSTATDTICPSWKPRASVYVFHSYDDDVVCFLNAAHLQRCMGDAPDITWDFGKYGGHMRSMKIFLKHVRKALK